MIAVNGIDLGALAFVAQTRRLPRLSGVPSGAIEAPAAWRDAIMLRGASWTMDQIRQRFGIA